MNYYGRYYRTKCIAVLHHINAALARWARRKYRRLRYRKTASVHWLGRLARRDPSLLYLWQIGIRPAAEDRSRMRREPHVRFREGGGVKFPPATRPVEGVTA